MAEFSLMSRAVGNLLYGPPGRVANRLAMPDYRE